MLWGIKSYSMQSWALNVPIKTTWLNSVSNQPRWGASDPNVNSRRRLKANFYSNTNFIFAYLQELLGPPPTDLLRSSVRVRITIGPLQWSVLCGSYDVISLPVVTVFFSSSYPDDNCPDDNCLAFICLSTPNRLVLTVWWWNPKLIIYCFAILSCTIPNKQVSKQILCFNRGAGAGIFCFTFCLWDIFSILLWCLDQLQNVPIIVFPEDCFRTDYIHIFE